MPDGNGSFAPILDSLTTAVLVLDATLTVAYINAAAESLLHISARQALGRSLDELVRPSDELSDLCRRVQDTALSFSRRELSVRVNSKEVVVDCRATPLEGSDGQVLIELFDAEGRLRMRQEAELVAQHSLSRRMVQQMAHEIKNPLGGLRGAAQLLERQLENPDLKQYTSVIIGEADRLARLVDGVLRPGAASQPVPCNIHEVTEHVASLLEAEGLPGVELQRDYDPSLPEIRADRNQLIQAYLNLARNALDAVGESGRIAFRTRALTNYVLGGRYHRLVITADVEDDGPGVDEDLKATVFYPLVTGKSMGTGLGLTIAQDLASQNGGLIEFTSQPGRTVFKLRVPVGAEQEKEGP